MLSGPLKDTQWSLKIKHCLLFHLTRVNTTQTALQSLTLVYVENTMFENSTDSIPLNTIHNYFVSPVFPSRYVIVVLKSQIKYISLQIIYLHNYHALFPVRIPFKNY